MFQLSERVEKLMTKPTVMVQFLKDCESRKALDTCCFALKFNAELTEAMRVIFSSNSTFSLVPGQTHILGCKIN